MSCQKRQPGYDIPAIPRETDNCWAVLLGTLQKKGCLSPTQSQTNLYSCGTSHMINERTFSGKTILPLLANRCITSAFQPYAKKYRTQANCYKCELSFVLFNSAPVVLTGWHCTDRMSSRLLLTAQFCISPNHCQDYLWNSKQHCSSSATVLIKAVVVRVLAGQGVCVHFFFTSFTSLQHFWPPLIRGLMKQ